uniref:Sortase n=1 Tax=candidate division WWE3 bacterium TaxID=2053526 RepID=A0A831Z0C3_UNCKA
MRILSLALVVFSLLAASLACSRADVPAPTMVPQSEPDPASNGTLPLWAAVTPAPTVGPTLLPLPAPTETSPPIYFDREEIEEGTVTLDIPRIAVSATIEVASEIDYTVVDNNPNWVPELSEIGQPGVALIYGHRQWGPFPKVFSRLDELQNGDQVVVHSAQEELTFTVSETVVVDPDQVWATVGQFQEIGKAQIALLTCTPWGTTRQRLIVFAALSQQGEEE